MPRASEKASANAIVKTPPMMMAFDASLAVSPVIKPRVVIIPDVVPKLNPTFDEWFIRLLINYLSLISYQTALTFTSQRETVALIVMAPLF